MYVWIANLKHDLYKRPSVTWFSFFLKCYAYEREIDVYQIMLAIQIYY